MTDAADASPRVVSGLGDTSARKHSLAVLPLDPRTYSRALDCVHCGLCLPACPTYVTTGLEADSPRGRIMLMRGLAEGRIDPTRQVTRHLDLCLDCRACETACPSGVVYHELIEETREKLRPSERSPLGRRCVDLIVRHVLPYPTRLRIALLMPRLLQRVGAWSAVSNWAERFLPGELGKLQRMLPEHGPVWGRALRDRYPADQPKLRVGFLAGCAGSVLFQDVNRQSVELLRHLGCEVLVPGGQCCCGAIDHHGGAAERARAKARRNIDAFLPEGRPAVDRIVTPIAGCGAMLREVDHLLRDDPRYADRAKAFAGRVRDISELLLELDPQPAHAIDQHVTYHDACHLAHAQGVTAAPRELLERIDGLTLIPLPESDMCCGAAGTYNLTEPEMSQTLAERKVRHIASTGASVCVTGNAGCAMQIESESRRLGKPIEAVHPVTLLHRAAFGPTA